MASAVASCSTTLASLAPRGAAPLRRSAAFRSTVPARNIRTVVAPKAMMNMNEMWQVAEEGATQYGSVDAPSWILPLGIVVVTVASILSGFLLKPGERLMGIESVNSLPMIWQLRFLYQLYAAVVTAGRHCIKFAQKRYLPNCMPPTSSRLSCSCKCNCADPVAERGWTSGRSCRLEASICHLQEPTLRMTSRLATPSRAAGPNDEQSAIDTRNWEETRLSCEKNPAIAI